MCNLYDVGGERKDLSDLGKMIDQVIRELPKKWGIRKTDAGVIVRSAEGAAEFEVGQARWGFHRAFNPAINNAREDKLAEGMWSGAWREGRRCVIPAADFYEWDANGNGGGGKKKPKKQPNAIRLEGAGEMWFGGLWEESDDPGIGLCFTTITTDANEEMSKIHHRMPLILSPDEIGKFLEQDGDPPIDLVRPYGGRMEIFPCENPLVKGAKPGPPQPAQQEEKVDRGAEVQGELGLFD